MGKAEPSGGVLGELCSSLLCGVKVGLLVNLRGLVTDEHVCYVLRYKAM